MIEPDELADRMQGCVVLFRLSHPERRMGSW